VQADINTRKIMRGNFSITDGHRPAGSVAPMNEHPNDAVSRVDASLYAPGSNDFVLMHHAQLDNRLISAIGLRRDPVRSAPAGGFAEPVR
jgi:hypothetical protein